MRQKQIKVLAFPSHADDEVLMAGGLIVRAKKEFGSQMQIRAYLMVDGFDKSLRDVRRAEFSSSCEKLGVEPKFFGFPLAKEAKVPDFDSTIARTIYYLEKDFGFIATIASEILIARPDVLIFPHSEDMHPDHEMTHLLVMHALSEVINRLGKCPVLIETQVWHPIYAPNLFVGFGEDVFTRKLDAVSVYESQLTGGKLAGASHNRYDDMMRSADRLNAIQGPEKLFGFGSKDAEVEYGELFLVSKVDHGVYAKCTPRFVRPDLPLSEVLFI